MGPFSGQRIKSKTQDANILAYNRIHSAKLSIYIFFIIIDLKTKQPDG